MGTVSISPESTLSGMDREEPAGVFRGPDGGMYLRWEPGVTVTTTTHTTTTTTHFPPVRLPLPATSTSTPQPNVSLPAFSSRLPLERFPLASVPTPEDLRFFTLDLGGKKVIFREEGSDGLNTAGTEEVTKGWRRCGEFDGTPEGEVSLIEALQVSTPLSSSTPTSAFRKLDKGKQRMDDDAESRMQLVSLGSPPARLATTTSTTSTESTGGKVAAPMPASVAIDGGEGFNMEGSPPRKRLRNDLLLHRGGNNTQDSSMAPSYYQQATPFSSTFQDFTNTGLLSPTGAGSASSLMSVQPQPQPQQQQHQSSSSTSSYSQAVPSIGSGTEISVLYSLPSLLENFEALPPKIKQHFLMHCFRRSDLMTIQRLSSFISPALKFDFVIRFPPEVTLLIFRYVDRAGLAACARVSRKWREMVDGQWIIWKERMVRDGVWFGHGAEEESEDQIRRRWEVVDQMRKTRDQQRQQSDAGVATPTMTEAQFASQEEEEVINGGSATSISIAQEYALKESLRSLPRSHPYKHIYRMRWLKKVNWAKSKPKHRFMFHGHGAHVVTCLQFDTDKIVSASDDHSINIYAIKNGHLRCRLDGHEGGVWALQYKGDVLVSGSTDRSVRIWSIEKQEQTHVFHGHTSTVRCLQIVEPVLQPNGEYLPPYPLIVTGSRDTTIRVWRLPVKGEPDFENPKKGKHFNTPGTKSTKDEPTKPEDNPFHNHVLEGHTQAVRAISAHGRYCVSGSYDHTVRVWDIVKGTCLHVLQGHKAKVYSVVHDPRRSRVASGSMDGTVKVWDLISGECLATLTGHESLVGLLGISPNYLVSAAADSTIKVWDANTLELEQTLTAHTGAITCFQHDEMKVISGSDGTLKLWDIKDGSYMRDLVTGIQGVWQVAISGRYLVSASNRNNATVFDVIDFGDEGFDDGAGDERLDDLAVPEWERSNRLEPRAYQTGHNRFRRASQEEDVDSMMLLDSSTDPYEDNEVEMLDADTVEPPQASPSKASRIPSSKVHLISRRHLQGENKFSQPSHFTQSMGTPEASGAGPSQQPYAPSSPHHDPNSPTEDSTQQLITEEALPSSSSAAVTGQAAWDEHEEMAGQEDDDESEWA